MNICCFVCNRLFYACDLPLVCMRCTIGARQLFRFPCDSNYEADGFSFAKFNNILKLLKEKKATEEKLNAKVEFLSRFVSLFRENNHTDILIKPGDNGPSIPAHRAVLAARSDIFKIVLGSDVDKALFTEVETITMRELNYEELKLFLEFLYTGNLSEKHTENDIYTLSIVAEKYEIPFLQKFCERKMLESLNPSNVLRVLEIAEKCKCYDQILKKAKNMKDIIFSNLKFKNPT